MHQTPSCTYWTRWIGADASTVWHYRDQGRDIGRRKKRHVHHLLVDNLGKGADLDRGAFGVLSDLGLGTGVHDQTDDSACNARFFSLRISPSLTSFHTFGSSFPSFCSVLVVRLFSTSSAYVFVCPPARPWLQPLPGRRSAAEVFSTMSWSSGICALYKLARLKKGSCDTSELSQDALSWRFAASPIVSTPLCHTRVNW